MLYQVDVIDATLPPGWVLTGGLDPVFVNPAPGVTVTVNFGYAPYATPTPTPSRTPTVTPTPTPILNANLDLSVFGIEVTQATQCFNDMADLVGCEGGDNSIPLVAYKYTAARVYVLPDKTDDFLPPVVDELEDIQVELWGIESGTGEILDGSPLRATIASLRWDQDSVFFNRQDHDYTANFLLPQSWTGTSHTWGIELVADVAVHPAECVGCGGNNSYHSPAHTFNDRDELHVYPVRVRWTYRENDLMPDWDEVIGSFAKTPRLYPVGLSRFRLHDDIYGTLRIDYRLWTHEGMSDLIEDLADHVGTCYVNGLAACGWHHGDIFMAMLHEDVDISPWSGMALLNSPTALSLVNNETTPPHEIGHALAGLIHASNEHSEETGGDWEEWPYPARRHRNDRL